MYDECKKEARKLGFELMYLLPPAVLPDWPKAAQDAGVENSLCWNVGAAYPNAKSIMLLIYPYRPYNRDEHISAYYIASNTCYAAGRTLLQKMRELGVYFERANVPQRAFARHYGIGTVGKNGLLSIPPYGSRIILSTFSTQFAPEPFELPPPDPCPEGCSLCSKCPSGAVNDKLNVKKCMRFYMDGAERPGWVMESSKWYLGCEGCLFNCPKNMHITPAEPPEDVKKAFDTKSLILGSCKEARALVTGGGKLTAEAIIFAARGGRYRSEILYARENSPFEAVRHTAEWAIKRYFE